MADSRAVLVGGPLDGHETAPRALPFVWVGVAANGVRVFDKPGSRRLLYRAEDGTGLRLIYAGDTHALCGGCDMPHPKNDDGVCSLCGAKLIPA